MTENEYGPAGQDYTLASGRKVRFVQPNLRHMARGEGGIATEVIADALNLIYRGRQIIDPAQILLGDQRHTDALLNVAQLVMEPRLKLDDDDEEGVVDVRECTMQDLSASYTFLVFGPVAPAANPQPADAQDAAQESAPTE